METGGSSARNRVPNTARAVPEENQNPQQQPSLRPNPERYVPISSVIRIMRRGLPPHAKIADDAKDIVQECVTEFITFVTIEANHRCRHECRRTITVDDIVSAMRSLGFDDYVGPLFTYLTNYRAHAQDPAPAAVQPRLPVARQNTEFVRQMVAQIGQSAPPPPQPLPMDGGDGADPDVSRNQGGGGSSSKGKFD